MDDQSGATRRLHAGRRLLTNPRQARAALRAGFQALPSATVAHLRRRAAPPPSAPANQPPPPKQERQDVAVVEEAGARVGLSRGAAFAGYTILRQLGAGGMAEVYLALHPRLPRRDVIKVLAEAITADTEFRERFNREADLAATLWHPHIVGVHDRGEYNGKLWISMDYVEGTDASRLVKEQYPDGMPADEVCAILSAVAGALDYAHDRGLLHRDVKPANILLTHPEDDERRILLADFGVARHLGDISGITQTNVAVGTVAYAAPEQLTGSNIDGRADQYALAATAFHLLTGAPPFLHPNSIAVISQHLNDEPPRLSERRPDLAYLDEVFIRALAKDPAERYERCRAFAAAFRAQLPDGCDEDSETDSAGELGKRGVVAALGRRLSARTRMAAALVSAVLIAVAATWSILYSFEPDPSSTPQPKPALAARPAAPEAPPAPAPAPVAATGMRVLDGTYRLDYDRSKKTSNGLGIRHDGSTTDWWAFHSVCTTNGCAATGVQLDNTNHQIAATAGGGQNDTLRFVAGYWQGAPQQERVACRQLNGPAGATQQETVAWSLAPQADGTLRGIETETVLSNECGAQGAVLRVPVVATRVGDPPSGLRLADPAQTLAAPASPASKPAPPVLGGACSDVDKLAYDQTSNEQVVCEGGTWGKAPITTGVHAVGSSCNRPDIPVFAMSASNDGYLIECNPSTRVWARHG
ncbi:serine/threonine-protein kinase [Mycobacterium asiaticum]|uniref:non-specific serine/threonine protein kinase n=1 Tax=Mycobacterium asiaticum TaxID=1790 RepID=A0A1A3NLC7_MYCAS|nr:serine/threonine-protein kinase [Mycobacterium asiaticum]OBK21162.1 nuclease PIN [Mycobacterium asiaticum]